MMLLICALPAAFIAAAAARALSAPGASIICMTASAWVSERRPLRKARRVNSPAPAGRAPAS